jgi:hypothetical protein
MREVVFAEYFPTSITIEGQEIQLSATWETAMRSPFYLQFHGA